MENTNINFNVDQLLCSIRFVPDYKDQISYISTKDGKLVTEGFVGENSYDNFIDLIKGLQGFGINIDNFYW